MNVSVAIIQLRRSVVTNGTILTPHDYDIFVLDEPSTSYSVQQQDTQSYPVKKRTTVGGHRVASTVIKLPSYRVTDCSVTLVDSVLSELTVKTRSAFRRVVAIPLWDDDGPSSSARIAPGTVLMCAPVLAKAPFADRLSYPYARLENLARLVNMSMQTPECLDLQTMHMIIRIEEWLAQSQRHNPYLLSTLFLRPSARSRVIRCAHNPAYVGQEIEGCLRNISGSVRSVASSVDLDEKVRDGNLCRVEMITYDKYNTFVMNPLFDSGLSFTDEDEENSYFIAGVGVRTRRRASKASVISDDWSRSYPMHRAAYVGDAAAIESLLALGVDAKEADKDSWTPLHYAAFYERLDAMRALLNSGNANVSRNMLRFYL
ncbi:hypothetical protein Q1695_009614 [Nippostrongylus brasiliensis]|nr:hypothetical protein Q1695_009614 [Nippostrongylus brasiliensis]